MKHDALKGEYGNILSKLRDRISKDFIRFKVPQEDQEATNKFVESIFRRAKSEVRDLRNLNSIIVEAFIEPFAYKSDDKVHFTNEQRDRFHSDDKLITYDYLRDALSDVIAKRVGLSKFKIKDLVSIKLVKDSDGKMVSTVNVDLAGAPDGIKEIFNRRLNGFEGGKLEPTSFINSPSIGTVLDNRPESLSDLEFYFTKNLNSAVRSFKDNLDDLKSLGKENNLNIETFNNAFTNFRENNTILGESFTALDLVNLLKDSGDNALDTLGRRIGDMAGSIGVEGFPDPFRAAFGA